VLSLFATNLPIQNVHSVAAAGPSRTFDDACFRAAI
jgi:hypothetical protein